MKRRLLLILSACIVVFGFFLVGKFGLDYFQAKANAKVALQYAISQTNANQLVQNKSRTPINQPNSVTPLGAVKFYQNSSNYPSDYVPNDAVLNGSTKEEDGVTPDVNDLPVIGGLAIPSVGTRLSIFNGISDDYLKYGLGTLNNVGTFGKDNFALAGHNSQFKGTLFEPLKRVVVGDKVYLSDLTNVYTYKVTRSQLVDEGDMWVISPNHSSRDKAKLTLVTCDDDLTKRLVVTAELVDTQSIDNAPSDVLGHFGLNQ